MLGSHQTRNLSDVFPSQLRDRYVQLSPAVSCQAAELQLSGHGGAPAQPPPAARPSNPEVKAKARLPTINFRLQVLRSPCGQLPQLFHSPLPSTT